MKKIIYSILIFSVAFAACNDANKKPKELSLQYSDQTYTLVTKGDGEQGKPGDFSIFSLIIKGDNGKVLLDRTKEKDFGKFEIPADSSKLRKDSPVDELLTILVPGDSAVLVYNLDSLEKTNPAILGMNSLTYEIAIKEIVTTNEMQNRILEEDASKQELKEASRAREATIAARTGELLQAYKNGELNDKLIATQSGLQYVIEKEGTGVKPNTGDLVDVHYYGILESNGVMFDNSYQRGEFFTFPVGQGRVIKGWDEALLLMNKGTEAVFFIPFELAYGAAGRPPMIPEKAMLVFYIEYSE